MPLPKDVSVALGVEHRGEAASVAIDPEQPFSIDTDIYQVEKDRNPFLAWLMNYAVRESVDTEVFWHGEKPEGREFLTYVGDSEASQADGVGANLEIYDAENRVAAGWYAANTATDEVIRFDGAISGNVCGNVTRNMGTAGAPLLEHEHKLILLPPRKYEGADMIEAIHEGKKWYTFNTSIVEWAVKLTGTEASVRQTGGDPIAQAMKYAWTQAQTQIVNEFIWSGRLNDKTGATPLRLTQGLFQYISTNHYVLPGFMTRLDLWDILTEMATMAPQGGALLLSTAAHALICQMAYVQTILNPEMTKLGVNIQQLQVGAAVIDLVVMTKFDRDIYLRGQMLFIPKGKHVKYRPLEGAKDRSIKYEPVCPGGKDVVLGHIIGEHAWEFFGEEDFARVSGIRF